MAKNGKKSGGGFSMRRENANDGGGIDGAKALIKEINFVEEFTYGGRFSNKPSCALHLIYEIEGFDKPWEDNYPLGPSANFDVSKDGYSVSSQDKEGLNRKSAAYFFVDALTDALEAQDLDINDYLPEEDGTVSVEPLEGLTVILKSKPFENVSGDTKDKAVIGRIVLDDEPAKGKGKSGGSKPSKSGQSVEDKTVAAIKDLLEEKTSVKEGDLANLLMQADRKNPDIKAMMNLCFKKTFLSSLADEGIEIKKGVLRLAEADEDEEDDE